MSELPTREELRKYLSGDFSGFDERQYNGMMDVCWAYVDGRLADREAVDYEAARVMFMIVTGSVFGEMDLGHGLMPAVEAIVDSAIKPS